MRVPIAEARELARRLLRDAGTPPAHAELQTDLLLEADLRGHPSHGLARLPRLLRRIQRGLANPNTPGHASWRSTSALVVDGLRGLGAVVGTHAIDQLRERAQDTGIAFAAISNTNHLGMLAWHVEKVAAAGQLAIAMSTSEALVHPHGGRHAMLGTNPLAMAVPATPDPFVIDLATSVVSMGKIHDHRHRGRPIPQGWARDRQGAPTTDPGAAAAGAIAPFGDAKGYALGLAIEVMVASLTSSALGTDVRGTLDASHPCNKGDLVLVIDPGTADQAATRITEYLEAVRSSPPIDPQAPVSVPGDRSRATRVRHLADGIGVADEVWDQLQQADRPS